MTLEYKLSEQDFLDFQLFTASKSEKINRKKRTGWLILTVASLMGAIYFFLGENKVMTIYLVFVTLACGLFYPKYFKWRYKTHYKTFIKANYSKLFGQIQTVEINNDWIFSKDQSAEGKIKLSEIEQVDETQNHFFLKISTGISLLIPKKELPQVDEVRDKLSSIGLTIHKDTNWSW